jgi:hypothetical protein
MSCRQKNKHDKLQSEAMSLNDTDVPAIYLGIPNNMNEDVKCCVAAVKSCPVLHFSVVIFFWSFGIIDASTIKC